MLGVEGGLGHHRCGGVLSAARELLHGLIGAAEGGIDGSGAFGLGGEKGGGKGQGHFGNIGPPDWRQVPHREASRVKPQLVIRRLAAVSVPRETDTTADVVWRC